MKLCGDAKWLIAGVFVVSGLASAARADFQFAWDSGGHFMLPVSTVDPPANPTGNITEATTLYFNGTFTYTGTQTIYIGSVYGYGIANHDTHQDAVFQNDQFISGNYTGDEFYYFLTPVGGLQPGATYYGPISRFSYDSTTASGLYDLDNDGNTTQAGIFSFDYYADAALTQLLGTYYSPNMSITIGSVPEPVTMGVFAPAALLLMRRRVR